MVVLRVVGEVMATVTFLIALAQLPIANVSAVLQALPLAVTMGAALIYGETVGWRRWLAIAAGFAGVAIIVRPGLEGFSAYSLVALVCVGFCTVRDLATRRIPERIPTLLISTVTAAAVSICGAFLIQPMGGWTQSRRVRAFPACLRGRAAARRLPVHHPRHAHQAKSPSSRLSATPDCFSRSCLVSRSSATFPTWR